MKTKIAKIVDEIANTIILKNITDDISLMSSNPGISLFLFHYSKYKQVNNFADKGNLLILKSFDLINEGNYFPFFDSGVSGVFWVIEYLTKNDFIDFDIEELYEQTDEYLYNSMMDSLQESNYDFLHGSLGIANYFLDRKTHKTDLYIKTFIDSLYKNLILENQKGGYFKTLIQNDNEKHLGVNFSLSHGLASFIYFLQKSYQNDNLDTAKINMILQNIIKYMRSNQNDLAKYKNYFPNWLSDENSSLPSRMAWCYGDLGIGLSLFYSSKSCNDEELKDYAIKVLLHTVNRKNDFVDEPGFCHGSSGIFVIYNELFKLTGIKDFEEASNYWLTYTLNHVEKDKNSLFKKTTGANIGKDNLGLLEGSAGIGLSLLEMIYPECSGWKKCLMFN